jgi:histidyl-tRNA synthetase
LSKEQVSIIEKYLGITGSNEEKITQVKNLLGNSNAGKKGIEEIEYIMAAPFAPHQSPLSIDFTLARGLNYYTGIIFEVKAKNIRIGSIGGGGRYDDLTGTFGVPNIPGVGISFGVDRIYDVMEELKQFPKDVHTGTKILFFNMGETESKTAYACMQQLRNTGMPCEIYHEPVKFDKQFKYAEKKNIPYIIIIGSKELEEGTCTIRNLASGNQQTIRQEAITQFAF